MRLFVGIELPSGLRDEIYTIQNAIKQQTKRGRFVFKDNFHLTIKFLGDVPNNKIEDIDQILWQATQKSQAFPIGFANLGAFGPSNTYRVVWLGLNGELSKLKDLYDNVNNALGAAGFITDKEKYQPHITLAREVEFLRAGVLDEISPKIKLPQYDVHSLALISSELESGKRLYKAISTYELVRESKSGMFA